jgi:hypothetical protein
LEENEMTDTPEQQQPRRATLPVGGQVTAVIPQSVEEIFRVARGVIESGLAPYSLVGSKPANEKVAAVAIVIMAGAEIGLPPMASLRSFTVIGGRPALYGDGLINAVRRARMSDGKPYAINIDIGFVPGKEAKYGDDAYGYCEAKRADTGEVKRIQFSVEDAKRAGLWDERPKAVNRKGVEGPNEAPWYRYPWRMLGWRAAGYCLRELFGDILGGLTDEYEAREIALSEGSYREVEAPSSAPPSSPPPKVDAEVVTEIVVDLKKRNEVIDALRIAVEQAGTIVVINDLLEGARQELAGDDEGLSAAEDIAQTEIDKFPADKDNVVG